ncbi:MAG: secondary thiamine-phosphate synthase enzyme YjbQ [Candidatus Kapabacteria bacterium]|jgi:secondary thiamine-phosphate synthase enzyme|nr:secondary thiamine-phosphate synthase enzyme YjbQ [Candidatus Kapabacteria bacterium]
MKTIQKTIKLKSRGRGFHIITDEIEQLVPEMRGINIGIANILIRHTSAGLTVNENADPSVRQDFDTFFDSLVPDDASGYTHTFEGKDDMTSHIKSSIIGSNLSLPISDGRFNLGTWQGIYLCEFRDRPRSRSLTITILGD